MNKLEELVVTYALNKNELDSYKKICEKENAEIKAKMAELDMNEVLAGDYVAKLTIQKRETMDEDMLLEVLRNNNYTNVIRTKEYVDMDLLEREIYNGNVDKDTLVAMQKCKSVKEVPTLKIVKAKKED